MIEKLLALQELEIHIDSIRAQVQIYPNKAKDLKKIADEKKKALDLAKEKLAILEGENVQMVHTLELEEIRLNKSKTKIKQITKEYELHALQREIDATKRGNAELEESIAKKAQEIEALKNSVSALESDFQKAFDEFMTSDTQAREKLSEFESLMSEKSDRIRAAEEGIDRALLGRFRRVRERRHQNAVVAVKEYCCQGCFMNIPHQMFNEMVKKDSVESCPNCQRLIFVDSGKEGNA